jgi:hypothetical protein
LVVDADALLLSTSFFPMGLPDWPFAGINRVALCFFSNLPFSRFTDTSGSLPVRWRLRLVLILFIIVSTWTGVALCPFLNLGLVSLIVRCKSPKHLPPSSLHQILVYQLYANVKVNIELLSKRRTLLPADEYPTDFWLPLWRKAHSAKISTKSFSSLTPSGRLASNQGCNSLVSNFSVDSL